MSTPSSRLRDPIGISCLAELEARTLAARSARVDYHLLDLLHHNSNEADIAFDVYADLCDVREAVEFAWARYVAQGFDPVVYLRGITTVYTAEPAASLEARIRAARSPLARVNGLRLRTGVIESIERAPDLDEPHGRPVECGALRIAQPGDNHDGGSHVADMTPSANALETFAGCHLDRSHLERNEPCDFSPLSDVDHVDALDMLEIEARAGVRVDTLDDGRARMRPAI